MAQSGCVSEGGWVPETAGETSTDRSGRVPARDVPGRATKRCPKCSEVKEASSVYFPTRISRAPKTKGRRFLRSWCRPCMSASRSEEGRLKNRLRRYGITAEQFERLKAHGKCQVCERDFVDQRHHPQAPVVDHDHATGRVRGVICRSCNLGLGYFNDDPVVIETLGAYICGSGPNNVSVNAERRKP